MNRNSRIITHCSPYVTEGLRGRHRALYRRVILLGQKQRGRVIDAFRLQQMKVDRELFLIELWNRWIFMALHPSSFHWKMCYFFIFPSFLSQCWLITLSTLFVVFLEALWNLFRESFCTSESEVSRDILTEGSPTLPERLIWKTASINTMPEQKVRFFRVHCDDFASSGYSLPDWIWPLEYPKSPSPGTFIRPFIALN